MTTPTTPTTPAIVAPAKSIFATFPPVIAMTILAVSLVAMAQFGSTEKLAAAFAWLIFVAVLLANGTTAFTNLSGMLGNTSSGAAVDSQRLTNG